MFDAIIMLRGGNMWFRPAISIWFIFAQSFFKFHKNGDIWKLKAWSFQLLKNDFCRLYNERARALQSLITIFLIHPVLQIGSLKSTRVCDVTYFFLYFVFCNLNFAFPKDNLFWISYCIYLKYKYTYGNAGFLYTLYRWFQNIKNFQQTIEIFHDFFPKTVTGATPPTTPPPF